MEKKAMKKNPAVAAVLSFFWPGLGQIYNGQIGKGVGMMVALAILGILTVPLFIHSSHWIAALLYDPKEIPGPMWIWIFLTIGLTALSFIIWFSQIVSAYGTAKRINKSEMSKGKIQRLKNLPARPKKEDSTDLKTGVKEGRRIRRDFKRWYER
jgi:TM2 domain-containing membrane protein YozV